MNNVTIKPHLLTSKDALQLQIESGVNLQEIINRSTIPEPLHDAVVLYVDGELKERECWDAEILEENQTVTVAVVPRGGGDTGKSILRIVAVIAVLVVAPYMGAFGTLMLSGGAGMQTALTLGFSALGMMAVNALIRPPDESIGDITDTAGAESTRTITGQSNKITPYAQVTRLYGNHKYYPKMAGQPNVYNVGEDSYMIGLYDFGYGGLILDDIRIGVTPITDYVADKVIHKNSLGDDFKLYTTTTNVVNVGLELLYQNPITRSSATNTDSTEVEINFPSGLAKFDNSGNAGTTNVKFSVKWRKEGSGDAYKFEGLNIHGSAITQPVSDGYVTAKAPFLEQTGTWMLFNSYGWNEATEITADVTKSLEAGDAVAVRVGTGGYFNWQSESYILRNNVSAGSNRTLRLDRAITWTTNQKTYLGVTPPAFFETNFEVLRKNNNSTFTIQSNTRKPFTIFARINFPTADKYEIVVERLTPDAVDTKIIDKSGYALIRNFQHSNPCAFRVPHTIYELKIKANEQINGVVQDLSAIASSQLRVYNGTSFEVKTSNNPAWIVLDVLTGSATKVPVLDDKIDIDSFYEFAQYCDEIVTHGISGVTYSSKRHSCNIVIDYRVTAKDLIESILSSARGSLIITTAGKFGIMADKARTQPMQLFTPRNSNSFEGSRSYADIPHGLKVKFVDPAQNWNINTVIVYADGYNESNATLFEELNCFGITDYAEAWRFGRYSLAQMIAYQENFTLNVDLEFISIQRGDLVSVQHDVPRIGGIPVRVKEVLDSGKTLILNDKVAYDSAKTYKYTVRSGNITIENGEILDVPTPNTVELVTANPQIEVGDLFVYGEIDHVTQDFTVKSITPDEDLKATIVLVPYVPEVYTADTGSLPSYNADIAPEITGDCRVKITDFEVKQEIVYISRYPHLTISLNWDIDGNGFVSYYDVLVQNNEVTGTDFVSFGRITKTEVNYLTQVNLVDFPEHIDRVYNFAIVAVDVFGNRCKQSQSVSVQINGDKTPPPDITHLNINILSEQLNLTWLAPDAPDLDYYIIRYTPEIDINLVRWEASTLLTRDISHNTLRHSTVARTGTYMIKAVDTSGNITNHPAYAVTTIPNLENLNVIEVVTPEPDWLGYKSNMEVNGTALQLTNNAPKTPCVIPDWVVCGGMWDDNNHWDDNAVWEDSPNINPSCNYQTDGYYEYAQIVDLGQVYTSRLSSRVIADATECGDVIANWALLSDIDPLAVPNSDQWNVQIYVSTSTELSGFASWVKMSDIDPISDTAETDWTTENSIDIGDFTGRYLKFKLVAHSENPRLHVVINSAKITVDMPDRILSENDIIVNDTGKSYAYVPPFNAPPAIAIGVDNAQKGHYYVISNKTRFGFDIVFRDNNDANIDGQFDILAKGYGRQLN